MSSGEIGSIVLTLAVLLAAVHLLGYLFELIRQPRLVGEIAAGVLLGPFVLGRISPALSVRLFETDLHTAGKTRMVLEFIYWIGLFLLMFLAGSETRRVLAKENRRQIAWLFGIGTALPLLLVIFAGSVLPLRSVAGAAGHTIPILFVVAIGVAVTSIPVISRIFRDLGIIHTRFASLVLSFAVLEDIVLWGLLAVATGMAAAANDAGGIGIVQQVSIHLLASIAYMGVGLTAAPALLKQIHGARWNLLIQASPVGYLFLLLFLYASIAAALGVNLVFAAFLAGFGVVGGMKGTERARFSEPLEAISRVGAGVFIPVYFALVGYKLSLGRDFSPVMLAVFLSVSSLTTFLSFGLAARLAGFRGLDVVNLVITKNARGGPGIVLASVAYEASIINSAFYTTLVLTAILTSQAAGVWLRYVLSKGWPLLSTGLATAPSWPEETRAESPALQHSRRRRI